MNLGRRRGDELGYQRGSGSVEVELANLQSEVEAIGPRLRVVEEDVRELRADRDRAYGMLKVIAALQVVIIGMFIAVFTWGLNHMTFHSDYERPEHSGLSSPQNSETSTDYHPDGGK